jgi:hypothetical protein
MKTPIGRIFVFTFAVWTESETCHRCLRAIIGNILDDREAWATLGTVDKWVTIATVTWVQELMQAIGTDSHIRRDRLKRSFDGFRVNDLKGMESTCGLEGCGELVDMGESRGFVPQLLDEYVQIIPFSIHFDVHACRRVLDPASEIQARGKVIHKGPETDPLDNTCDMDA